MRIRTQIALTTALILAALAVMTLSSLYQQRVRLELANRQEKIHQMVQEAQELSILSSELLLYPSARVQAQWRLRRNAFSRLLEEQQSWLDQSGGELIADVTDEYLQLGKLFRQMEKLAPFADDVAGDALLRARLATQMLSRSRQLSALLQEFDALERAFGFAKLRRVGKRILVANFLAFGLVASLLLLLWFNLTRQLADLRRGFERVADGELDHRVNHVCRDEFGELARGFDRMTEQVACQTRRLQASQKELASINRELEQKVAERTAELDQANAELERAVRQLYDAGAELAQTERLLTLRKLVASVSHELNNPLMGALNYVQYVRSKFAEHPEIDTVGDHLDAWLAKAERDILRASRVTENLLKYDQISAGHQSALWPARLVNEVLELADPALQRAGVLAENRVEQSLRQVQVNHESLQQVLLSLILNAIDALKEAPQRRIIIDGRAAKHRIELSVEDTGRGVPEPIRERIFEPFFTTKPQVEGAGLGLAVARRLIEAGGGELTYEPRGGQPGVGEPVGGGARFVLRLPPVAVDERLS